MLTLSHIVHGQRVRRPSTKMSTRWRSTRISASSRRRDFTSDASQHNSNLTISSMRRDDDAIRDFASQFMLDEVFWVTTAALRSASHKIPARDLESDPRSSCRARSVNPCCAHWPAVTLVRQQSRPETTDPTQKVPTNGRRAPSMRLNGRETDLFDGFCRSSSEMRAV